jgi:hypothetical protein
LDGVCGLSYYAGEIPFVCLGKGISPAVIYGEEKVLLKGREMGIYIIGKIFLKMS